ncbi:Acetyltransferase (GNAT) family protein [Nakamurella panacisegetis]|uniref:Acetyltransferase (GNAT) family protein n=1 Tax=Nakamurella panacisegetis TaxID=1090615 RepID=A0A1H0MSF0_9ACTN|nr:GNAT family N-acetyltransferase [Nakamurella panacisegetis]SDO83331.1 Acetyltransferase (GNAT) family protein [Nakamurella panacisegetis]
MTNQPGAGRRIVIAATAWDSPAATGLREAQQEELRALYDGDTEPGVKPSAADVTVFLLALEVPAGDADQATDAIAVACGGLRPLGPTTAEIKRMYVRPSHRGAGLSRLVLDALEASAVEHGWTRLMLETGPLQKAAMGLYTTAGYAAIPAFGAYADSGTSLCFGKTLA